MIGDEKTKRLFLCATCRNSLSLPLELDFITGQWRSATQCRSLWFVWSPGHHHLPSWMHVLMRLRRLRRPRLQAATLGNTSNEKGRIWGWLETSQFHWETDRFWWVLDALWIFLKAMFDYQKVKEWICHRWEFRHQCWIDPTDHCKSLKLPNRKTTTSLVLYAPNLPTRTVSDHCFWWSNAGCSVAFVGMFICCLSKGNSGCFTPKIV